MEKERVRCAVCGRDYQGKIPKGRDGTILFPRKHSVIRSYWEEVCQGSFEEGEYYFLASSDNQP